MNILVLGSGGREHALAWKIAQDAKVTKFLLRQVMQALQLKINVKTLTRYFR
jgi:phosphoribosylamine-glycine ligase